MVELPEDILRRISDELDRKSAAALARAGIGGFWREVGERRLWSEIDLTAARSDAESEVGGLEARVGEIGRLLELLLAHRPRARYIKCLIIPINLTLLQANFQSRSARSLHFDLIGVLQLVSPTVQVLDLYLTPISSVIGLSGPEAYLAAVRVYEDLVESLNEKVEVWEGLLELGMTVFGEGGLEVLRSLISRCPRLRSLVLRPLNTIDPSPSSSSSKSPNVDVGSTTNPPQTERFVRVPTLRSLSIIPLLPPSPSGPMCLPPLMGGMAYKSLFKRINEIMDSLPLFPRLEWVSLEGPHPYSGERLGEMLKSLPMLKGLYIDGREDLAWERVDSGETESGLKDVWLRCDTKSDHPGLVKKLIIPPLGGLLTLTLLCASSAVYRVLGTLANMDMDQRPIPGDIILQLRKAPLLTTINFAWIEPDFKLDPTTQTSRSASLTPIQLADMAPNSINWEGSENWQMGCLVTSYRHPSYPSDPDFELFHLRVRVPDLGMVTGGDGLKWVEGASYRGNAVPLDTLRSVYEASGTGFDWRKGDREAVFGPRGTESAEAEAEEKAWETLDEWYCTQACASYDLGEAGEKSSGV